MNAIETHALTRRFGAHTAVDGLDLTVRQGELFALLGVNGAGKTTTLRMLSGLLQPTGGEADILGFRLTQQPQEIKRRINLSPQETAVAPNLTVRENLELIAGIYGASRREAAQRAAETIAEFHLGEVERSRAKTLSGGWQRRLSIAMALISQPQLVFLDEPTLGLDVLARRELWQVIRSLRGRVTVILTTHYLEEAEALSDRIGILSHGRLRICGTAQELCAAAGETRFEEAHMTLFEPEQLAPGVSVFSLSFLALFSALLLSRDRSSALILRLYASPLTGRDFILGYLLPMLPMALAQTLVCLLAAIPLGLPVSWRILACTVINVPIALVNLALGMLCGTLLPEKAVGGMCGALLTNVSAWLSGIWFSLDLGGKVFRRIAYALPFANAVDAARAALAGDWGGMFPQLWIVLAWAFGLLTAAIVIFRRKMTAR